MSEESKRDDETAKAASTDSIAAKQCPVYHTDTSNSCSGRCTKEEGHWFKHKCQYGHYF